MADENPFADLIPAENQFADLIPEQPSEVVAERPELQSEVALRDFGGARTRAGQLLLGIPETALQLATGAAAAVPAGLAGLAAIVPGGRTGAEAVEDVSEALTFQPRTEAGQLTSGIVGQGVGAVEQAVSDVAAATGDPEDVLGATLVKTAILGAPLAFLRGIKTTRPAPPLTNKQQALTVARDEGFVAPPATVSPKSRAAAVLETSGGKVRTQQEAMVRNQEVTNNLAARAVGLTEETILSPEVLGAVRAQASGAYEAIRNTGQIITDTTFRKELSRSTSQFRSAAKDFPELAKSEIIDLVDSLRVPKFDAASGIDAIRLLRNKADVAFRSGDKALGNAYREASAAIEGTIERHLQRGGNATMLEEFRAARQQIATTYSVEAALDGSTVSATKLAAQLKRGKPLTGDLKLIARFAQEFPRVTRSVRESFPGFSPLDVLASGGSVAAALATGQPAALIPAVTTALRSPARRLALSERGQRLGFPRERTTTQLSGLPGAAVSGALSREEQ